MIIDLYIISMEFSTVISLSESTGVGSTVVTDHKLQTIQIIYQTSICSEQILTHNVKSHREKSDLIFKSVLSIGYTALY